MSATISGNSGGLPANEMKNLPKPVHVTKTKCPYCVGKQIDVKDIEAHMVNKEIDVNLVWGCGLTISLLGF